MANNPFVSVNETHFFVFPVIDFFGYASGVPFTGPQIKLNAIGDWWFWGMLATRVETLQSGEMPSGTPISINIWDPALSQYWWTGGSLIANALLPLQLVAGKAGNPGVFAEPKLVKGGSILVPYLEQFSGAAPTGSSQLYVALIATLANSAKGNLPVVPSLGGVVNERKGESYKALVTAPLATNNLAVGSSTQYDLPLNKQSSYIITQLTCDTPVIDTTDPQQLNPLSFAANILVNIQDTRTIWHWASPTGLPIGLMFGNLAARPAAVPSFLYMEADQNLQLNLTNNTPGALSSNINFVFDGFLNDSILGERVH